MFDLDGTLVHTAPEIAEAANLMRADLNKPALTFEQVQNYIGHGAVTLIKRCVGSDDEVLLEQAKALFFKHYKNNAANSKPFDGVEACLKTLQAQGYQMACVTNKPAVFTEPLLEKSGLASYFTQVVSGDTLAKKKPDPMQLLHICKTFDVPITEALMVGDSNVDIQAASAAGCFVVTVPYGYNQGKLLDDSRTDAQISDLTELPALLA